MRDFRINEQIIRWVRENSKNDKMIEEFIIDLIYEEAEHSIKGNWREIYKKKIKKYLKEQSESDEN